MFLSARERLSSATWLLACVLSLVAFCHCARAAEHEKTTAELVGIVKNSVKPARARVEAAIKLGEITSPDEEHDNQVADSLIEVVKQPSSLFVRSACVTALGKLQANCNKKLKDRFRSIFVAIIANTKEYLVLRSAVAGVFKEILDPQNVPDKDGYKILADIAKNRQEAVGFRGTAIEAVGKFGADDGIELLAALLSDPEELVREKAAGAIYDWLSRVGENQKIPLPAITKMTEMLDDKKLPVELKVNVMKALAQMMREGNTAALRALDKIKTIVKTAEDHKLLLGGIEALGIVGSADAVDPLKQAYLDYLPAPKAAAPAAAPAPGAAPAADADASKVPAKPVEGKDVEVRQAVMDALVTVLSTQVDRAEAKKPFDTKAVHDTSALLVKAIDDDPSATVKTSAVFAMQYLYKFPAEQKEALDSLITYLRTLKKDDEQADRIITALKSISGQDFDHDVVRWDTWYQQHLGGKPRPAPPR